MATPANTVLSVQEVGKKLSFDDKMKNISPWSTPFASSLDSEPTNQILTTWLEDTLRDPRQNAAQEGADATINAQGQPVTAQNTTQIFEDSYALSRTAGKTAVYGRPREQARIQLNAMKALKLDHEYALVGTGQVAALDNGSGVRSMGGAQSLINSSMQVMAGGSSATSPAPLSEDILLQGFQLAFEAGSDPTVMMIKPTDAPRVANFATRAPDSAGTGAGRSRNVGQDRKLINVVDVYVCAFGTARFTLNRLMKKDNALLYDPSLWVDMVFDEWKNTPLAKTGDSDKYQIVCERTLKHRAQGTVLFTNLAE